MTTTDTPATTDKSPQKALFPPWSPFVAIILVVAIYFGAAVIGEASLYLYGAIRGWSTDTLYGWLDGSPIAQFANAFVVYTLMAVLITLFVRRYKVSLRRLGVVRPNFGDVGRALLAIPVYAGFYFMLLIVITALVPSLDLQQEQQLGFDQVQNSVGLVMAFLSLVILPPLVEEFVMRGFVFTSLLKRCSFVVATVLTSILFAVAHLQAGSGAPLLWVAAIDTCILSAVLCYLRYKSGSLWPGIFLHMFKNLTAFLVIFVFKAN